MKPPFGKRLANKILLTLDDMKAHDTVVLDVKKTSHLFDILIITSGHSSKHVQAITERIIETISQKGLKPLGVEGQKWGDWVLIDYGDVVVHIMQPETRQFYQLEKLWAAYPQQLSFRRGAAKSSARSVHLST